MLRAIAVLTFVLAGLAALIASASAQNAAVYPPLASACDIVGGERWTVPGDGLVDTYEGCTVRHQPNVAEFADQIECPPGTYFSLAVEACEPIADENLNDGWYDEFGNPVPSQGECPEGHFIWSTPDNGLDHDICSPEPEDVSGPVEEEPVGDGKGVYPVVGTAYVAGTNGDGLICRDAPNGAPVTTLAEGTELSRLDQYVMPGDGWQMVAYQESETVFPSCFVLADYLSDSPPATSDDSATEVADDAPGATSNEGSDNSTESTEVDEVTSLPRTGHGPAHQQATADYEPEPPLTPGQRQLGLAITVILTIGLLIAQPWRTSSRK